MLKYREKLPYKEKCILFGWNSEAWYRVLNKTDAFTAIKAKRALRVLEIGAGNLSACSLIFSREAKSITIGFWDDTARSQLNEQVNEYTSLYPNLNCNISKIDATDFIGKYDVIIMKSVMGGVFRNNSDAPLAINTRLQEIVRHHTNYGGYLITLDNGEGFFHPISKFFGSRCNNWYFAKPSDFIDYAEQTSFGFFSIFSFSTRLGTLGRILDRVTYNLDIFIGIFTKTSPTIICSVYRNRD
ncbi:hypothetical protein N9J49_06735 [Amylibacter sp.]|nr:hypothetical protein [Amylibacter sp.]